MTRRPASPGFRARVAVSTSLELMPDASSANRRRVRVSGSSPRAFAVRAMSAAGTRATRSSKPGFFAMIADASRARPCCTDRLVRRLGDRKAYHGRSAERSGHGDPKKMKTQAPTPDRTILITGASSGIGAGLAVEFARRGYGVAIAARRMDRLEALAPQLRAAGAPQVVLIALDVADTDAIEPAVQRAAAELGRLDVVVANAG